MERLRSLVNILVERDGMHVEDAKQMVRDARQEVKDGADPEEILYDDFGLEPDYIFQLL